MGARFQSKVKSFFLRFFLLLSWILLVVVTLAAIVLTLYPNILPKGLIPNSFGVWYSDTTINKETIALGTGPSILGWVLISVALFAFIFGIIMQVIARKSSFKIGKGNKILGYFGGINVWMVIFVVMSFFGAINFGVAIPKLGGNNGILGGSQSLLFTDNVITTLGTNNNFPLLPTISNGTGSGVTISFSVTWVYFIFAVLAIISVLSITITTIKVLFNCVFARTHDKEQYYINRK